MEINGIEPLINTCKAFVLPFKLYPPTFYRTRTDMSKMTMNFKSTASTNSAKKVKDQNKRAGWDLNPRHVSGVVIFKTTAISLSATYPKTDGRTRTYNKLLQKQPHYQLCYILEKIGFEPMKT